MSGSIGATGATGPTEDAEAFAELLRGLKERSGLSYGALAKRLDMSTSTLHRYCNGSAVPTGYAPVERLARVCRATGEELVELHRRWILADAARARRRPGPNGTEPNGTEPEGTGPEGTGPGGAGPERTAPASTGSELRTSGASDEPVVSGAVPSAPARSRQRRTALIASVAASAALGTVALTASLPFSGGDDGDRMAVGDTPVATGFFAGPADDGSPPASGSSSPSQRAKNGKPSAKETPAPKATKTAQEAENATTLTPRQRANAASSQSNVLIKNVATGECADLPGYGEGSVGGSVNQHPACLTTSADNQLWDLVVADRDGGPGGASLFVVKNNTDGLCMDLPDYGTVASETKVTEYYCDKTTSNNQLWYLAPLPNSTYWIRNLISNLCLSVSGGSSAGKNAHLQVTPCGDTATSAQRWSFS